MHQRIDRKINYDEDGGNVNKLSIMLMMLILVSISVGVASAEEKSSDYPVSTAVVVVGNGRGEVPEALELESGDYFKVVLYAAGGTGYNWALDNESLKSIEVVANSSVPVNHLPLAGGPVRWEFYLRLKPGATEPENLHFYLSRPWDKNQKPAQMFDLAVAIKTNT